MNLDKIVRDSTKYIAEATGQRHLEVFSTYLRELDKQQCRYCVQNSTFHIPEREEERQKTYSLQVTGRYYRRYFHDRRNSWEYKSTHH